MEKISKMYNKTRYTEKKKISEMYSQYLERQ